jgi:hypothetical protein
VQDIPAQIIKIRLNMPRFRALSIRLRSVIGAVVLRGIAVELLRVIPVWARGIKLRLIESTFQNIVAAPAKQRIVAGAANQNIIARQILRIFYTARAESINLARAVRKLVFFMKPCVVIISQTVTVDSFSSQREKLVFKIISASAGSVISLSV